MDMRVYYRKVRETEAQISGNAAVVKSLETPDGGKPGIFTEVSPRTAGILVTDGRAVLASAEEAEQFRAEQMEAKRKADEASAARQLQVTLVRSPKE